MVTLGRNYDHKLGFGRLVTVTIWFFGGHAAPKKSTILGIFNHNLRCWFNVCITLQRWCFNFFRAEDWIIYTIPTPKNVQRASNFATSLESDPTKIHLTLQLLLPIFWWGVFIHVAWNRIPRRCCITIPHIYSHNFRTKNLIFWCFRIGFHYFSAFLLGGGVSARRCEAKSLLLLQLRLFPTTQESGRGDPVCFSAVDGLKHDHYPLVNSQQAVENPHLE